MAMCAAVARIAGWHRGGCAGAAGRVSPRPHLPPGGRFTQARQAAASSQPDANLSGCGEVHYCGRCACRPWGGRCLGLPRDGWRLAPARQAAAPVQLSWLRMRRPRLGGGPRFSYPKKSNIFPPRQFSRTDSLDRVWPALATATMAPAHACTSRWQ